MQYAPDNATTAPTLSSTDLRDATLGVLPDCSYGAVGERLPVGDWSFAFAEKSKRVTCNEWDKPAVQQTHAVKYPAKCYNHDEL